MVMQTVLRMMTTAMASPMKIQTAGIRTAMVCPTVGKLQMASTLPVLQTQMAQTAIQTVTV